MSRKLRWALRILGWLCVAASLAPRWTSVEQGPGAERSLRLGFPSSPLYERDTTVIHAGVANVAEPETVKSRSRFHVDSLSMLALVAGAVLVSVSNRRARS